MSGDSGLTVRDVTVSRGLVTGLDVHAPAGAVLVVTGSAGSGKSTLLAALAGRLQPATGSITLHGMPIDDPRLRGRVGIVTQAHELVPTMTATENVALSALKDDVLPADGWAHAGELLTRLDLPPGAQANLAEELSGGQHQRVAVARALAGGPVLVLADDPTSELDATSTTRVIDALLHAAAHGAVVVATTSEPRLAAAAELVAHIRGDGTVLVERQTGARPGNARERTADVLAAHTPTGAALRLGVGDEVRVLTDREARFPACVRVQASTGEAAWVPRSLLGLPPGRRRQIVAAIVLLPYDTSELRTVPGSSVAVLDTDLRGGWALCRSAEGAVGRVPLATLDITTDEEDTMSSNGAAS